MPLDPHAFALARTFEERNGLQVAELNKLARRLSGETWAAIQDNSITEPKYGTDSVSQRALAPDSVTATEIQNGAVGQTEIADGSVTRFELAAGAALDNIGGGGIGSGYLAGGAALANIGAGGISSTYLGLNAATVGRAVTGATSSPAAGARATCPEMSITADFGGNNILVLFRATITGTSGSTVDFLINDSGVDFGHTVAHGAIPATGVNGWDTPMTAALFAPPAGTRTISIVWTLNIGAITANGVQRSLEIVELRR